MNVNLKDFDKLFLGEILGIGVTTQEDSKVLIVHILVEDDGNWFPLTSGFSSYWLSDFRKVLAKFDYWVAANTVEVRWGVILKDTE